MTTVVSLQAAQALKAAGFPQDCWPQMIVREVGPYIRRDDGTLDSSRRRTEYEYWQQGVPTSMAGHPIKDWYAAPPLLTGDPEKGALDYCEGVLGYLYAKSTPDDEMHIPMWTACVDPKHPESSIAWAQAEEPYTLLESILRHGGWWPE